jgi:hypothetical protein
LAQELYARIGERLDGLHAAVGGAIVDHDDLSRRVRLVQGAANGARDLALLVKKRDHGGDGRRWR